MSNIGRHHFANPRTLEHGEGQTTELIDGKSSHPVGSCSRSCLGAEGNRREPGSETGKQRERDGVGLRRRQLDMEWEEMKKGKGKSSILWRGIIR